MSPKIPTAWSSKILPTKTFPAIHLASYSGGAPAEVTLIAQLGAGQGDALITSASRRQREHPQFADQLNEPSTKLGDMHPAHGDRSTLHSFAVGENGHPFHRHAGARSFTAVSGSVGTRLRFSTASDQQLAQNPQHFINALREVVVPPDCLFTVRFPGSTWHQFLPAKTNSRHPALFALSCHPDELAGALSPELKESVMAQQTTIHSLTELLPESLLARLNKPSSAPVVRLSLDRRTWRCRACDALRAPLGRLRSNWARKQQTNGLVTNKRRRDVYQRETIGRHSLLQQQLDGEYDYQDCFSMEITADELAGRSASQLLGALLLGFIDQPPMSISLLMRVRNLLVQPLGLRTASLGCPVSSLLSQSPPRLFAGRFPVLDQHIGADDHVAEVILGADDKHLRFRSCVGVEHLSCGGARLTLANRVKTRNLFGRMYMRAIDYVHRRHVGPTLLRQAATAAIADPSTLQAPAAETPILS